MSSLNMTALRPSTLTTAVSIHCEAGNAVFISGPPGIGKSQLTHQMAASLGMEIVEWRLSQLQQTDLLGLPKLAKYKNGEVVEWVPPKSMIFEKPTILFVDELTHAPHNVQAAAFQLIQERRLGDVELPDDVWIVAASNREQDMAIVNRMSKPMQNRFAHFEMVVSPIDWFDWAEMAEIRFDVIAYLKKAPDSLFDFDPKSKDYAFATPRTWEKLSKAMDALDARDLPRELKEEIELPMAASCVGSQHATQYISTRRMLAELPDFDEILANPETSPVPELAEMKYVVSSGLARMATKKNFGAVFTYLKRLPGSEFLLLAFRLATKRDETLFNTPVFKAFAKEYQDVLDS